MRAFKSRQREISADHRLDRNRRDEITKQQLFPRIAVTRQSFSTVSATKITSAATAEISIGDPSRGEKESPHDGKAKVEQRPRIIAPKTA